jgi:hypothetical protein
MPSNFKKKYSQGLEPMTPSFTLHSSTTELLKLCLEDLAELNYVTRAKILFPEKTSEFFLS